MRPMNPTLPYPMPPAERLDEVARLLALGFLRLRARRNAEKANEPNHLRESLDWTSAAKEACVTPTPTPTESAHDRDLSGPQADRRVAEA
jgi:hypothetical protein